MTEQQTPEPLQKQTGGSGLDTNVAATLSYLCGWVTGLVFLVVERDNQEVKFHAWQSVIMNVALIVYLVASAVLGVLPFIRILVGILNFIVISGVFVLYVLCMVKAYQGMRLNIPVISDIAQKQASR